MPSIDRKDDVLRESVWSFETANFLVEFTPIEEDSSPADHFESPEDIEYASRGDFAAWFTARVRVWLKTGENTLEELASDYLGACSYESFDAFVSDHRACDLMMCNCLLMWAVKGDGVVLCTYFPEMVAEAVSGAREALAARAARYTHPNLRRAS